jgi:hypothetical protein
MRWPHIYVAIRGSTSSPGPVRRDRSERSEEFSSWLKRRQELIKHLRQAAFPLV